MSRNETLQDLQTALSMELTAAHQYQLHASVLGGWGMDRLSGKMRQEMQEELGHSDEFLERILFLKGTPNLTLAQTPKLAGSLQAMFQSDLEDEQGAIAFYTAAARRANDAGDIGSRGIFERIVLDEEQHMAWLELQLELIQRMGESAYISIHISAPGAQAPA